VAVAGTADGWHSYADADAAPAEFAPAGVTKASDPLLLYFTSGTTSQPKLVGHTHASYPAGHLSTMYWIGTKPGDVHLNISSPGWAKHAWSNLYVGRTDDVFKACDYRISPFELESVLIEHDAVAEAAVVPSPDPIRLAVPKAYVILTATAAPGAELARDIMAFCRERVAPYKRIRRIEFADLPKTISGKIRRVELRAREADETEPKPRGVTEFWEEDFSL
jgi:acyl-coenzyme A synthetase/AMP-(fatty) acid ligase